MCQRVDEAKDEMQNETPHIVGVILLLLTQFSEKEDSPISVKDVQVLKFSTELQLVFVNACQSYITVDKKCHSMKLD